MSENRAWELDDFIDSLVVELDKTRETLAVKAINKQLSYTVKELALDLNIFPTYDGEQITFLTAQPGQEGASKVSIELGSITDQQVRATSRIPSKSADVRLGELDVDPGTRRQLRRLGVNSVDDLRNIERKDVDIEQVADEAIDYTKLANVIQRSRRNAAPPRVRAVSLSAVDGVPHLVLEGENLAVDPAFEPVAVINQSLADVTAATDSEVAIRVGLAHQLSGPDNELIVTFDPYAVTRMNVRT